MKLTSISAVGLKGPDFKHRLSAATAIVGPNAAGKTRILQAIRLALAGWLPECGKTPRATWELASGPEMEVEVQFDDGTACSRKFWMEGTTVKGSAQCREPVGVYESLPLLNAEAYFEMTDSQRVAYVFERIKLPDTYTPAAIIAECERLSFEEAHTEQIEVAKGDMMTLVRANFLPTNEKSVQENLGDVINELRESFTYWNARAKSTQGAVTTLAELKLREPEVVAAAQGVDAAIKKAQGELDELNTTKGQLQMKQEAAERRAAGIKGLRSRLDADRIDYPRMIQNLQDAIALDKKKLAPELDKKARENLVDAIRSLKDELADMYGRVSEWGRVRAETSEQLDGLDAMKCCPYCHSRGKDWKATLRQELTEKVAKLDRDLQEGREAAKGKEASIVKMETVLRDNDALARANILIHARKASDEAEIDRHQKAAERESEQRTTWQADLDALEALPVGEQVSDDLDVVISNASELREQISALEERKTAETRLRQQLVSAAQAELEHQDAAAHVTVIKAIAKLLKDKREAMIEDAFADLLTIANKFTVGIVKGPICMHEGTIGRWDNGKFVPHRVFSGTEKALTYIAIAVALSSTAPLKLVILDEFGRLDADNQTRVIGRLSDMVFQRVIDQYVVVGTSLPNVIAATEGVDWSVIEVE